MRGALEVENVDPKVEKVVGAQFSHTTTTQDQVHQFISSPKVNRLIPGPSKECPMDYPTLPIGFQTGPPLEGPGMK